MNKRKIKKGLALLLSVAMVFSTNAVNVLATEGSTSVIYEHHRNLDEATPSNATSSNATPNDAEKPKAAAIITGFTELAEEVRFQNGLQITLPETLEGTVDEKTKQIPVTWESDSVYDAADPMPGLYLFTAEVDEDYTVAEGIELPKITAIVVSRLRIAGLGTIVSPLQIINEAQLREIAVLTNAGKLEKVVNQTKVYLRLENDLDLMNEWIPIGTDTNKFKGDFDGAGHTITGLEIDATEEQYQGLFGVVSGGMVKNLNLVDVSISGGGSVGSVVGMLEEDGAVESCSVSGRIIGNSGSVGGVVGNLADGTVKNCSGTGSVSGTRNVGGIAGSGGGSVSGCLSTSSVVGTGTGAEDGYVGGIVGSPDLKVTNCAALNHLVSGKAEVGRVAGRDDKTAPEKLSGNVAFSGIIMTVDGVITTVNNGAADNRDGAGKTADKLQTSDGFPTIFTQKPWTYEAGKLPGLGGAAVELPGHISTFTAFGGTGTEADPYTIDTEAQLRQLAQLVNTDDTAAPVYADKYYKVTSGFSITGEWLPIGTQTNPFKGHFNGNRQLITGLTINSTADHQGLFGVVNDGTIKALRLEEVHIKGATAVGGVAGAVSGGTVFGCSVSGSISGSGKYIGGIVGDTQSGSSVEHCDSTGSVSGKANVGGVAGNIDKSTITTCLTTASVTGTGSQIGGIVGEITGGTVKNCAALNPRLTIGLSRCGRVTGDEYNGTMQDNFAFDNMVLIIGGKIHTVSGSDNGADKDDGLSKSAAELQLASGFPTALTQSPWNYEEGKLPGLDTALEMPSYLLDKKIFEGGTGTSADPYQIATEAQLRKMAQLVNEDDTDTPVYADKYYKLTSDITLTGQWVPIGIIEGNMFPPQYGKNPFKGNFDGGSFTISGLTITEMREENRAQGKGLFGYVKGGTIQNINLKDISISKTSSYTGGVVGALQSGTVKNCTVSGSISDGEWFDYGGVAGYALGSTIENCYSTANVECDSNVGGVAGRIENNTEIINCYSTGIVSASRGAAGGVVGVAAESKNSEENKMSVRGCVALNPSASSDSNGGRIVGGVAKGFSVTLENKYVENNYAFNGMIVTQQGNPKNLDKGTDKLDGGDMKKKNIMSADFWKDTVGFDENVWTLADEKLPILTSLKDQSDDLGIYITPLAPETVSNLDLTDLLTAPEKNKTPEGSIKVNDQYTGTVTWSPKSAKFLGDTAYTATVTLTVKEEKWEVFTFNDLLANQFIYKDAVVTHPAGSGDGKKLVVKIVFPKTGAKTLAGIKITTPPKKTTYQYGESFDGADMVVKASYDDTSVDEAFTAYTVDKTTLSISDTKVTLTATGNKSIQATQSIIVNKADAPAVTDNTVSVKYSDTEAKTHTLSGLPKDLGSKVSYDLGSVTDNDGILAGDTAVNGTTGVVSYHLASGLDADKVGKTATIPVTVTSENYENITVMLVVTVIDKTKATITGLTVADGIYSGAPQKGYTGTPDSGAYNGNLTYAYASTDGGSYSAAIPPTNAGTYSLKVSVPADDVTYTGSTILEFSIAKKEVTVKADDKNMTAGDPFPIFTVTYTGFVGNENSNNAALTTPAVAGSAADGKTAGSFDITLTTPAVLNATVGANYTIVAQTKGILTVNAAEAKTYVLTVNDSYAEAGGAGSYTAGTVVTISAGSRNGYTFTGWSTSGGGTFAAADSANTTFTMPAGAVTITANWRYNGGGGSSSGSGSSSNTTANAPVQNKPNTPTRVEIKVPATVDHNGKMTVNMTRNAIIDAINSAIAEAKKNDNEANGISLVLNVSADGQAASGVSVNLPKTVQEQIISQKIVSTVIVVNQPDVAISMDLNTIKEINRQANGDVNIIVSRRDNGKLTGEAKTAIGSRPVFDFSINYGSGKTVSSFGAGRMSIMLPYILQAGEKAGNVGAVYVDTNGKVNYIMDSSYDTSRKNVIFTTYRLSTCGVGYKADAPAFTDTTNHWANHAIGFVAARGLLTGTDATTFSPDSSMTRGMFAAALGTMANVDVSAYKTGSFTDVKAAAQYAPYVNWAAGKGIIGGTTATTFAPDQAVTRQEMAQIMFNYAKAMGNTMPKTRVAVTFADNSAISSWAVEAVKTMQQAGVIMGKDGNRYDPAGSATRAEAAAVLLRYVELVIDHTTAQGLDINDSGRIVYYENGKLFTGTKNIDGTTCHFGNEG